MEPWPLASITCSHGGFTSAPMFHTHTRERALPVTSVFSGRTWWGHEFLKCIWIIWRYLKIFEARKHVTIMSEFFRVICMWSYLWDQSKDSKCSMEVLHKVLKSIGLHLRGFVMFLGGFLWRDLISLLSCATIPCLQGEQGRSPSWRPRQVYLVYLRSLVEDDWRWLKFILTVVLRSWRHKKSAEDSTFLNLCAMPTSVPFCVLESNSPRQLFERFDLFEVFDEILELGLFEVFFLVPVVIWPSWDLSETFVTCD